MIPNRPSGMTVVLSTGLTGENVTFRPLKYARKRFVPLLWADTNEVFTMGIFWGMKSACPVKATETV